MNDTAVPGADDSSERPITSWEDILDDTDWLYEDDDADGVGAATLTDTEKSALWQRFGLTDAAARLSHSITQLFGQPTMDFEHQYQAGYQLFAEAGALIEQHTQRIDAAGAEFEPIVAELRVEVERQRGLVAEYFEEHTDRHERYRKAMIPVRERMAEDNQRAARERHRIQKDANDAITGMFQGTHDARVKAFDDWNQEWLREHRR